MPGDARSRREAVGVIVVPPVHSAIERLSSPKQGIEFSPQAWGGSEQVLATALWTARSSERRVEVQSEVQQIVAKRSGRLATISYESPKGGVN